MLVSENVCGTLETRHTGRYRDTPPIQDIVAQLMANVDETGEPWFVEHIVLRCNAGGFVQQKRPRLCFKLIIVVFVRCWIVATRAYLDFFFGRVYIILWSRESPKGGFLNRYKVGTLASFIYVR